MTNQLVGTHARGQASVHAVIYELGNRGFRYYLPGVDDHGVDILIVEGSRMARIQVKRTNLKTRTKKGRKNEAAPYYEFNLASTRAVGGVGVRKIVRKFSEEVEFLILHGADENKFWIVPAHLLDNKKAIILSSNPKSKEIDWEEAKRRRDAGETFKTIAENLGVTPSAVYERTSGISSNADSDATRQVRASEGRWDLLTQFFNPKVTE